MRNYYSIALFGLSLGWVQCHSDEPSDWLQLAAGENETLVVTNHCDQPVSYYAVESELSARIDWGPFSREDNTIPAGATRVIGWDEIFSEGALSPGKRVIFYWWPIPPDSAGPYNIQYRTIEL